jgi:hypothetical protein
MNTEQTWKKLVVAGAFMISLLATNTMASVSIIVDALNVNAHSTLPAPQTTLGLLVVDKTGDGFITGTLNDGLAISIGSYWGGSTDDLIIGADRISSTGTEGYLSIGLSNYTYPSGVTAGMKFGIVWLPDQPSGNSSTLAPGWYGLFSDSAGTYSAAWVLPPDPTALSSYDMTTVSQGGSVPNSAGNANYQIIPEPSTWLLVGSGLLGVVLIRRRKA